MDTKAKLPKFLQPYKNNNNLVRIGRDNDGGYLIDKRNIQSTNVLIGLGISDDWSFEEDFYSVKKVQVFAVDGSIHEKIFFNNFIRSLLHLHPVIALQWYKKHIQYKRFFQDGRYHIKKLVGMDLGSDFVSLSTLIEDLKLSEKSRIFIKIDIEGWEYRILDDLIGYSDLIEGMVIEFHDVDLHLERIQKFIEKFSLNLCHIHCNNFTPINKNNIPLTIECSFTRQSVEDLYENDFPNKLDMSNDKNSADYVLMFE